MKFSSLVPQSFRRLKPKEKRTALVVGGVAAVGVLYLLHRKSATSPQAPASRISVAGAYTELATKLGLQIGADLDVRTAQRALNKITHSTLVEDGKLGPATKAALRTFQLHNGIPQTGIIDEETGNALQYMVAATSKNPVMQQMATLKTPPPVTYHPSPMPQVPYASPPPLTPAQQAQLAQGGPVDIGGGWVMHGNCACQKTDQECIRSCGNQQATAGDFFAGIQSTQMYDPRFTYGF